MAKRLKMKINETKAEKRWKPEETGHRASHNFAPKTVGCWVSPVSQESTLESAVFLEQHKRLGEKCSSQRPSSKGS